MSAADRPWWATGDDELGRADAHTAEDPLLAHRAARRGAAPDEEGTGPEGTDPGGGSPRDDGPADDGSWWVPATEAVTRLARDLAASAVASPPPGLLDEDQHRTSGEASASDEGAEARRRSARGDGSGDGPDGGHRIDACGVCPICVGLRALGEARPDLVGHLAEAARHVALAVRTVVDAAAPADDAADPPGTPRRGRAARGATDDLHRIDLDD